MGRRVAAQCDRRVESDGDWIGERAVVGESAGTEIAGNLQDGHPSVTAVRLRQHLNERAEGVGLRDEAVGLAEH